MDADLGKRGFGCICPVNSNSFVRAVGILNGLPADCPNR